MRKILLLGAIIISANTFLKVKKNNYEFYLYKNKYDYCKK